MSPFLTSKERIVINLLFEWLGEAPANRRLADYVVDGRKVVIAHGTRDMPIWGDRYTPNQLVRTPRKCSSIRPTIPRPLCECES